MAHDPLKFASGLSAKLAARSRHVCMFFGAGISKACGLPNVAELQLKVLDKLDGTEKSLFQRQLDGRNLERALSRIRRIAALLSGEEKIDGLTSSEAATLDKHVCEAIVEQLNVTPTNNKPLSDFAAWASRADYHSPLEIFTVNYDLLIEGALEEWQVAYFDGFIGTIKARFRTELVEPLSGSDSMPSFFTRLWKLHGSLNWEWDEERRILRRANPVSHSAAAIYPSDTKYDESRRMPFVVLQDRFRRALHHPETLTLISGYSFGDEHLNEIIFDAATRRQRSEIVVFCYSQIPESLASRAAVTPNIQVVTGMEAIIGGTRASWDVQEGMPADLWINGNFALRDFGHLASYLAKSVAGEESSNVPTPARSSSIPSVLQSKSIDV